MQKKLDSTAFGNLITLQNSNPEGILIELFQYILSYGVGACL